jgi:dipeptidyl aminopeptidase/acylaminoacyl peptidase
MKRVFVGIFLIALAGACRVKAQQPLTIDRILSAPFPEHLTAAKGSNHLAWTLNQEGQRNIWVAEGPSYSARQLTSYKEDDGEELSDLQFTTNGNAIVYVRGEGKNSSGEYANPTSNPAGAEQTVWMISWNGGAATKVDEGHSPCVSIKGPIAYARGGQIWLSRATAEEKPKHVVARGKNEPVAWSPDGTRLLFVSDRGDHNFIGIYDDSAQTVKFLAPSVDADSDPVWSLDGKRVAFVRRPAKKRDAPDGYFIQPDEPHPWSIWVADAATGHASEIWHSGAALQDSYPYMAGETGGGVINWAAENRMVFANEQDGWQHLYEISADGGAARLLTPGNCEVEQWSVSSNREAVLFNSNCEDVDRRHVWSLNVMDAGKPTRVSGGESLEWNAVFIGPSSEVAFIASDAIHPPQVYRSSSAHPERMALTPESWPKDYPSEQLVVPQQVVFKSADGLEIHGQLFLPKNLKAGEKRPALIFMHGGPMRQMLLGWHYMYYYANSYGMNQYLANRGYVVLAINYRSGIGYGRAFREAPGRAGRGATEYQDVVAAGKYLQSRAEVDGKRIGLWGGSYGGFLTALGLGRNSELFSAGVDIHGVHDWPTDNWEGKNIPAELAKLAHESSPVTSVDTWRSPVLFIHGDDDRNVIFSQTVDLVARLRPRGVHVEQLVFPDEIHDFLLHANWLRAYRAASEFFDRQLAGPK